MVIKMVNMLPTNPGLHPFLQFHEYEDSEEGIKCLEINMIDITKPSTAEGSTQTSTLNPQTEVNYITHYRL